MKSEELKNKNEAKVVKEGTKEKSSSKDLSVNQRLDKLAELMEVLTIKVGDMEEKLSKPEEPAKAEEPVKAEPAKEEPKKAESKKEEPKKAEPAKEEPKKAESKKEEPKKAESKKEEPAKKAEDVRLKESFGFIYKFYSFTEKKWRFTTNIWDAKEAGDYTPIPARFDTNGRFHHILSEEEREFFRI